MTNQKKLRIYMIENDLTQRKLAVLLGISKSYVDDVFKNKRPALHIRQRLTELGFPPELVSFQRRNSEVSRAA